MHRHTDPEGEDEAWVRRLIRTMTESNEARRVVRLTAVTPTERC